MLDIPEVEGVEMPKPHEFLSAEQRDGSTLQAEEIYKETWEWLRKVGCAAKVSPHLLERYAVCSARWIQCEEMTNRMGFLSKHPTTQKPMNNLLALCIIHTNAPINSTLSAAEKTCYFGEKE